MKNRIAFIICVALIIAVFGITPTYADKVNIINDELTKQINVGDYYQAAVDCTDGGTVSFSTVNKFTPSVSKSGHAVFEYTFNDNAAQYLNGANKLISETEICMVGATNGLGAYGELALVLADKSSSKLHLPLVRTVEDNIEAHTYSAMINTGTQMSAPVWTTIETGISNTRYIKVKTVCVDNTVAYYIDGKYISSCTFEIFGTVAGMKIGAFSPTDCISKPRFLNFKVSADAVSLFKMTGVTDSEGNALSEVNPDESLFIKFSNEISAERFLGAVCIDSIAVEDERLTVGDDMKTLVVAAPLSGWESKEDIELSINNTMVTDIFGVKLQPTPTVTFASSGPLVYIAPVSAGFEKKVLDDGSYMSIDFNARNLSDESVTVAVILLECSGDEDKYCVVSSCVSDVTLLPQSLRTPINASAKITSDNTFFKAMIWSKYGFNTVLVKPIVYSND